VIAIPIAFLASDRIRCGLLRGEQTILLAQFGVVPTVLLIFADRPVRTTFGSALRGPAVAMTLLGVALQHAFCRGEQSSALQTSIVGDPAPHTGPAAPWRS
jgi:hypothetical protein